MLSSTLGAVSDIAVVDRENMKQMLEELLISQYGPLDDSTAQILGNRNGANYILSGQFYRDESYFTIEATLAAVSEERKAESFTIREKVSRPEDIFAVMDVTARKIASELGIPRFIADELPKTRDKETKSPEAVQAFYRGLTFFDCLDYDQGIDCFAASIKLDPDYEKAHRYFILANERAAVRPEYSPEINPAAFYEELLKRFPNNPVLHNYLGNAYFSAGMMGAAKREFKAALQLQPSYASPYNNLGNSHFEAGDFDEALSCYQRAIDLEIYEPAIAEYNMGLIFNRLGDRANAERHFNRAIELQPFNAEAYAALGVLSWKAGDTMRAQEQFKKAVNLNANLLDARYNLGLCLYQSGQFEQAVTVLTQLLDRAPSYYNAAVTLSACFLKKKDYAGAEAILTRIVQAGYEKAVVFENLGLAALAQKDSSKALSSFSRAAELETCRPICLLHLSKLYLARRKNSEALQILEPCLKSEEYSEQLNSYREELLVQYAAVFEKLGDLASAKKYYNSVLIMNPKNHYARLRLARLENAKPF